MSTSNFAAIILAAGKGTRMKSSTHKVLHSVGGKPMLMYLLDTVNKLDPVENILVVGAGKEQLMNAVSGADFVEQTEQLGTGHAARIAVDSLPEGFSGDVIILFGDVPFIPLSVMEEMIAKGGSEVGNGLTVLGFRPEDAAKYGRLVTSTDGKLERIVEFKDASEQERAITLCNSGMMLISGSHAKKWLHQLSNDNAAGEYYLTDLVEFARKDGFDVAVVEASEDDVLGINSREDLARAELAMQKKWRKQALDGGVTMTDPDTVYFSHDTKLGFDVTIEPNVFFGPGSVIENGVTIKANSHIEGAHVRANSSIGPFARLRPAADIGEGSKIGNFVEIKKTKLHEGVKVSHLTYLGDAEIGADANIGAGTITCNYDGFLKYKTSIGAGAFIGSNSALVAPVTIGDGAIVGAGSIITKDVEVDSLAVARGRQRGIPEFAANFREEKAAKKAAQKGKK
ncbi:bifunctional UDP-N-acetylglucosamine diphosphorylase/glucosamine-1-phosphate N-acetyltransferase GlmU [Kordiimonas laminariae]|uniref:bifunctional UDP-N-acetylglucosamine diphosphorylase/glucosamine-1-phosphate N-acetyltransferase GlmU n=1 Tax=Kordiimonas laminariae TaxID=2917717 RepID=UPI001FF6A67C|nr:bifunctional UDP-N-acetylglucosamine diphosphorylase/glucosamine-1-phosphate N-acetyltransferase GlmU [Kordiimonas laminariae]MCK0067952.1 bifunctional UDP-N-acetylglucosamine diphosphorylase/glucosamine-1-phosphate N-acetyltransferase GlmU [Kordiimonas laminariae]